MGHTEVFLLCLPAFFFFPFIAVIILQWPASHLEEGWLENPGQMSGMAEESSD